MEESPEPKRNFNKKKLMKCVVTQVKKRIPILDWLPKYNWRENIVSDMVAGVTLMIVNVPQGLAFSVLANVDLIYGLYTSCLASLIYTFLGTATISSFGPVAVGSMLTGEAVSKVMNLGFENNEIAVVMTFLIGIWYLVGFILKLGVISMIFRKPFVSGFITACALHILAKSVKMVLGVKTGTNYGMLSFFYNLYSIFENINAINYPTVIISVVIIFFLILNTVALRPLFHKCTKYVIPMEAVVMIVVTLLSYFLNFESMGVPVVGNVPTGFPMPKLPQFNIIPEIWDASLILAVINYSTTLSMTLLFNNELKSDQELLAMGVVNIICCNLQCITIGNSMMRTIIVVNLGVTSLMATIISSLLLVFVVLFGGPLFYTLPNCVLGCIILTSAGQLLLQRLKEVKSIWNSSIENGLIWLITLATGLITELQFGLIVGALLSLRQIMLEVETKEKLEKNTFLKLDDEEMTAVEPENTNLITNKTIAKII